MSTAWQPIRPKDYATYLSKMAEVTTLRPTHPIFLNRLAGAYALNGKIAEAAATLERLVALSLSHDVQSDPDFAAVKDDPRIAAVAAALRLKSKIKQEKGEGEKPGDENLRAARECAM